MLTNLQASQSHLNFINSAFLNVLGTLLSSLANSLETSPPPSLPMPSIKVSAPLTLVESPDAQVKDIPKKARKSRIPDGVVPGVTPPPVLNDGLREVRDPLSPKAVAERLGPVEQLKEQPASMLGPVYPRGQRGPVLGVRRRNKHLLRE